MPIEESGGGFGNDCKKVSAKKSDKDKYTLNCSFCGKSQDEVRELIAGPLVFICDECVELCMDIIKAENRKRMSEEEKVKDSLGEIQALTKEKKLASDNLEGLVSKLYKTLTKVHGD